MSIVKLNKNAEFKRLYKRGNALIGKYMIIYVHPNKRGHNRIGITVSKKLGCAVVRNRVRRLILESFRLSLPEYKRGYDFVIVGRSRCIRAKMPEVRNNMDELIKKGGYMNV